MDAKQGRGTEPGEGPLDYFIVGSPVGILQGKPSGGSCSGSRGSAPGPPRQPRAGSSFAKSQSKGGLAPTRWWNPELEEVCLRSLDPGALSPRVQRPDGGAASWERAGKLQPLQRSLIMLASRLPKRAYCGAAEPWGVGGSGLRLEARHGPRGNETPFPPTPLLFSWLLP